MPKNKVRVPNVIRGGVAIPLGNNFYYMKGRKHSAGGIDIGKDLEVEDDEVIQVDNDEMKVFSSVPFLRGVSPSHLVLGGANPNIVFNAQERFKDVNKINDDGTRKKKYGDRMKYIRNLMKLGGDNNDTNYSQVAKGIIQLLDPTGISSYPDIYESYKNNDWVGVGLNTLSAIPLLGKIGKATSLLMKANRVKNAVSKSRNVIKVINKFDDYSNTDKIVKRNIEFANKVKANNDKLDRIATDVSIQSLIDNNNRLLNIMNNPYRRIERIGEIGRAINSSEDIKNGLNIK